MKKANENCKKCKGTGILETVDWVDYGSTTVQLVQHEECECVEEVETEDEE